jgi:hypothetical protein
VVAALFLVLGGDLSGWSLLVIVIVLAVFLGLLQLVAGWARRVSPPPIERPVPSNPGCELLVESPLMG